MKKFIIISNDKIRQVIDYNPAGTMHPDIKFLEVPTSLMGFDLSTWNVDSSERIKASEVVFAKIIKESIKIINEAFDKSLQELTGSNSSIKRDTWSEQRTQAEAVIAETADQEVIASVARRLKDGETAEQWAHVVINVKVPYYKFCEELAIGTERRATQAIEAVNFNSENNDWVESLAGAFVKAKTDADNAKTLAKQKYVELASA